MELYPVSAVFNAYVSVYTYLCVEENTDAGSYDRLFGRLQSDVRACDLP